MKIAIVLGFFKLDLEKIVQLKPQNEIPTQKIQEIFIVYKTFLT